MSLNHGVKLSAGILATVLKSEEGAYMIQFGTCFLVHLLIRIWRLKLRSCWVRASRQESRKGCNQLSHQLISE
jgi:hypothetical protein